MVVSGKAQFRSWGWAEWWLTTVLALAAALTVGFGIVLLLGREDSEALESPLLLAVARQLHAGPWELYGPYNSGNHLVLIHAPLYYHLSALLAWPLARLGVDSITASLCAGRSLSLLGLVATMAMAYRLARLDGAPSGAGVWAALLLAGAPIMGRMPYAVRPDLLGIAFQTTGVLLVLAALGEDRRRGGKLLAAFAAFGLAFCTKQHFLMALVISTGLLMSARRRGRVSFKQIERGVWLAISIVVVYFGIDELMTGGRMSRAVIFAARCVGVIHPESWNRASTVVFATVNATEGLLTLMAAAGFAAVWLLPGWGPRALRAVGASLIGLILVPVTLQVLVKSGWLMIAALSTTALIAPFWVAAGLYLYRGCRQMIGERVDRLLWLYLLGEMALVLMLYCASTGAWFNYAIQAVVFLAVLTGRALGRILEMRPPFRSQALIAAAALVCLGNAASAIRNTELERRIDRQALEALLQHERCAASAVFVVDRPGLNRRSGRLDLVYDEWLYPVFETLGLAEPRAIWLVRILTSGNVRYVVNTSEAPGLDGIPQPLRQMGYFPKLKVGPFFVWERRRR